MIQQSLISAGASWAGADRRGVCNFLATGSQKKREQVVFAIELLVFFLYANAFIQPCRRSRQPFVLMLLLVRLTFESKRISQVINYFSFCCDLLSLQLI